MKMENTSKEVGEIVLHGCHVSEIGTHEPKPCVFPFGRIVNGEEKFFEKCVDIGEFSS